MPSWFLILIIVIAAFLLAVIIQLMKKKSALTDDPEDEIPDETYETADSDDDKDVSYTAEEKEDASSGKDGKGLRYSRRFHEDPSPSEKLNKKKKDKNEQKYYMQVFSYAEPAGVRICPLCGAEIPDEEKLCPVCEAR